MKTYAGKSLKTGGADKKQTYVRSLLNAMMVSKNLLCKSKIKYDINRGLDKTMTGLFLYGCNFH